MWNVTWHDELDSTNSEAVRRIVSGDGVGTVIAAKHQIEGRGRLDRQWEDTGGSLLCTVVLPLADPPFAMQATLALAALDAIEELAANRLRLKWPNDLIGADGKVGGMLAERCGSLVAVGIGINLQGSAVPVSVRHLASSIEEESGQVPPTAERLLEVLLRRLSLGLQRSDWHERYEAALATIGEHVRVEGVSGSFEGRALGIGDGGELHVEVDGKLRVVAAGDVIHLRTVG
ncbi:MAG: biotin--[acetyl-CoA-carboxylase] ligase [Acidimicrobiia bacterium]